MFENLMKKIPGFQESEDKEGKELDNLREKIKGGEGTLEKLMRKIPGFEGYKNREQARTAGQIQRKFMAKSLAEHKGKMLEVGQEMLRSGNISLISEVDRVTKIVDKVVDKIEHATYGYSGLFDAVRIGEMELDTLYEYDLGMINNIASIGEAAGALEASLDMDEGNPKRRLKDLEKAVKELDKKVSDRKKILMGVE